MSDIILIIVAVLASLALVGLGFLIGGIVPSIIKNSTTSDVEVIAYLKEKADESGVHDAGAEEESARLEKKLYNLELSMACVLGDRLEQELMKERQA